MDNKPPEGEPKNLEENETADKTVKEIINEHGKNSGLFDSINMFFRYVFKLPDEVIASKEAEEHLRASAREITRIMTDAVGAQYFLEVLVANHPLGSDLSPDERKKFIETLKSHISVFFDELEQSIAEDRKGLFETMKKR